MSTELGRSDILGLFEALSRSLQERGARADLFLVGGAAVAVAYDDRRATRDLDAAFAPTDVVRAAAQQVAQETGLPEDWLNDAVKGFLPGPDPGAQVSNWSRGPARDPGSSPRSSTCSASWSTR